MSTYLAFEVKGFRSLLDCEFRINEGLNVLVGPNGSGKTNVAALLDFVSNFVTSGIYAALASSGGAVRVFSHELLNDKKINKAALSIGISGTTAFEHGYSDDDIFEKPKRGAKRFKEIHFEYALLLSLDKSDFSVSVSRETISWHLIRPGKITAIETIEANANVTAANTCTVSIANSLIHERMAKLFSAGMMETMKKISSTYDDFPSRLHSNAKSGYSLLKVADPFVVPQLQPILAALSFSRSSNIIPDKVRDDQDIASSGEIESDGSGTISRLYQLQTHDSRSKKRKHSRPTEYQRILESFYKINEHIQSLSIEPNLRTGKLDANVSLKDENSKLTFPFSWVSDGTAKWLAILTVLRFRKSGYCIEEPENYIHPAAQRMFISTLRDIFHSKPESFFIINTHSETIVNELSPSELMVCDYASGTRIRRLENPEKIRDAINETGFGLGHLYANQRV